jgi:hypothetical protein
MNFLTGTPRSRVVRRFAAIIALAVTLMATPVTPDAARAIAVREQASVVPRMECRMLMAQDFTSLPDAPAQISAAEIVPAAGATPEHCHATGYIAPQIQFDLRLPVRTWSGRYLQIGCGGLCDLETDIETRLSLEGHLGNCTLPDLGEFALGHSNTGHTGPGGLWAKDAPQARIDWAYRSEHALSVAAKAIIADYYGQPPRHAYFAGCSNGGRQALMLAQRFPDDFDGILAGAPAGARPAIMLALAWNAQADTGADGGTTLTPDTLPLIHQAAMAECDGHDGLTDGQIDDPRACRFDPATLLCPDGQSGTGCLASAQVETVRKLYSGPISVPLPDSRPVRRRRQHRRRCELRRSTAGWPVRRPRRLGR